MEIVITDRNRTGVIKHHEFFLARLLYESRESPLDKKNRQNDANKETKKLLPVFKSTHTERKKTKSLESERRRAHDY